MNSGNIPAHALIEAHPEWYHSIELTPGIVTPGRAPLRNWEKELRNLRLPDLRGKSVLDIGAYDGFFSFAAERLGAARVVALDHYVWSTDMVGYMRDWREARDKGHTISAPHQSRHWQPDELPGRRPFDAARKLLGSKVEPVVADFMEMDFKELGSFDVVLFLGVLYHLKDPFAAIRQLANATCADGLAVIETEATEIPGAGNRAICEFFPSQELNNDASNWWAPNARSLSGMCRAAGFQEAQKLPSSSPTTLVRRIARFVKRMMVASRLSTNPIRYRLIMHATK